MIAVNQEVQHWQRGVGVVTEVLNTLDARVQFSDGVTRLMSLDNLTDLSNCPLVAPKVFQSAKQIRAEAHAAKLLLSQQTREAAQQERLAARAAKKEFHVPSALLAYVCENYTELYAAIPAGFESRFEATWLEVTGCACDQPYYVSAPESRWGLGVRIEFPTPPAGFEVGGSGVLADPDREGCSFICKNDFFWEVVAVVKQLGPRLS